MDDEEDNYDNIQRRKNSTKRRPLDPPPADPPLIHKRMEKMAKNSYVGDKFGKIACAGRRGFVDLRKRFGGGAFALMQ